MITLNRLGPDGLKVADEGRVIIDGDKLPGYRTLEGPKLYKREGVYWVFAPAGGVKPGWQSVFRSRAIGGPYEARIVLDQGGTDINGPHQGAWITTPAGEDWFIHFQDVDAYGRVVHLQPMRWRDDGWPVMGADLDGDGKGEPVRTAAKPKTAVPAAVEVPPTTDEFTAPPLGLQWQWQANPRASWLSLAAAPGRLRLFSQSAPVADNLWMAPNLLLQKWPAPEFVVTTLLRFAPREVGEQAGLVVFGQDYAWVGLRRDASGLRLVVRTLKNAREAKGDSAEQETANVAAAVPFVHLRVTVARGGRCRFAWSADGRAFAPVGEEFQARAGVWVGAKVGLFAMGRPASAALGHADWDWFHVEPPSD